MPELGFKQDAFNVLYGTVPLYWVAQPYSYNWSKPELRERLLESYRNACKLHEQIGFEEMVSHEFVTADREVQHTTFGDGTQVWVNFGAEPWTLRHQGKQYALPQYGFYAAGPKLQQYRVLEGGRRVTCVRAPGYLFADADVPGVLEFALDGAAAAATERTGGQTCRVEGPGRLRVNFAPGTKWVKLNPAALCPGSGRGAWRVADLAADGTVRNLARPAPVEGGLLRLEPGGAQAVLLVGPEALADHAEVVLESLRLQPTQPRQGQATVLTARLTNLGGRDARALALGLAPVGTTLTVKIPAGQTVEARFNIDTRPYDGTLRLTVTAANQAREICTADNNGALGLAIAPDWALWDTHSDVTVRPAAGLRRPLARLPLSAAEMAGKDLLAARVALVSGEKLQPCPAQVLPLDAGYELVWQLPEGTAGAATCRLYFDSASGRHARQPSGRWNADSTTYSGDGYSVVFADGYIRGINIGEPSERVLSSLGASSKDTGWVEENGQVESFEVVSDGPLCTQVRVKKKLAGNHFYDKLYTFYPDRFAVAVLASDRFGTMSRAYYLADGVYEDDKGLKAIVDGKGDAEGISGANAQAKWYVIHGNGWAVTNTAVTPFQSIGYWDGGNKAGVGFSGPQGKDPETVMYFLHVLAPGVAADAKQLGASDYAEAQGKVEVQRGL